jgi:uncharacterized protein YaeQ
MANPATLYRFRISVSDVERDFYESLDFRAAMHPSETEAYLLTRVIAYVLNSDSTLEFAPGLCAGDEPAIHVKDPNGGYTLWIDIGNPTARKMHKASKAARRVRIYTYKDIDVLKREAASEPVHRASEIEVFALDSRFLDELGTHLGRENRWSLIHDQGELVISIGEENVIGPITLHRLDSPR